MSMYFAIIILNIRITLLVVVASDEHNYTAAIRDQTLWCRWFEFLYTKYIVALAKKF